MRNEIEARDPTRLEEATDVAAAAIAARHGMGSVAGQLKAYVITAPVGALRDRVDPFSVGANEVRSRALRKRLRRRSRIIRSSRRNLTGGIGDWFRARHNRTGNLPLFPGIFPDQLAPIVRNSADGEGDLVMARGHAGTAAVWRPAGHQHPQRREPALAQLARNQESLPRPGDELLRVREHDADVTPPPVMTTIGSSFGHSAALRTGVGSALASCEMAPALMGSRHPLISP